MTTERNAQGVDVLAVMGRDAQHANRYRCITEGTDGSQAFPLADVGRFARESDEARAAVAELVGAINEYRDTATAARAALPGRIELTMKAHESATTRLRAALAKFPEPRP